MRRKEKSDRGTRRRSVAIKEKSEWLKKME